MTVSVSHLLELDALAREEGRRHPMRRDLHARLVDGAGRHFVGVLGPRGVGKTVLLKQLASEVEGAVYLSADTLGDWEIFDVVRQLHRDLGFTSFLLDEIHFAPGYDGQLKKVFDFLDVRVVFTSSVALALAESAFDLARRVRIERLLPFSFREYLAFTRKASLPRLTLAEIEARAWSREHLLHETEFDAYLRGGLMPFALEEAEPLPLLEGILDKIVMRDAPRVARITVDELELLRKLLTFVGRSPVDGINYSALSRNLGITKYKAQAYVDLLCRAFVLQIVLPRGANVLREPKVLMAVPYRLLFRDWDDAVGGLREDFFAEAMRFAGLEFDYLKTTRGAKTPDYLVRSDDGDFVVEIGGTGKGRSQFKGFWADRKLVFSHPGGFDGPRRPLYLLGFLA